LGQRLAQALLAQFPDLAATYSAALEPSLWPLTLRERDSDAIPCSPGDR
jgi:hypothetical protein